MRWQFAGQLGLQGSFVLIMPLAFIVYQPLHKILTLECTTAPTLPLTDVPYPDLIPRGRNEWYNVHCVLLHDSAPQHTCRKASLWHVMLIQNNCECTSLSGHTAKQRA